MTILLHRPRRFQLDQFLNRFEPHAIRARTSLIDTHVRDYLHGDHAPSGLSICKFGDAGVTLNLEVS